MSQSPTASVPQHNLPRVVGHLRGDLAGPTLLIIASLHGNEPAGLQAAQRVFARLAAHSVEVRGECLALAGNLRGLALGQRYIDTDLNRHWTVEVLGRAGESLQHRQHEDAELQSLRLQIHDCLERARGTVYAIDLHTTSNVGAPFVTAGDTLRNRRFAAHFHTPVVLGLEEELRGTLLEYLYEKGCVTMGFEAGQHVDPKAIDNHEALIWVALVTSGVLAAQDVADLSHFQDVLGSRCRACPDFFEILYRHAITGADAFRMRPGFTNFQAVAAGEVLGEDRRGLVRSPRGGLVLMPLYQGLGSDGFFVGRPVRAFWLRLSAWVRCLHLERFMLWLPGVGQVSDEKNVLRVDTRVARFYPLQVFHLLGYRRRRLQGRYLYVSRRHHDREIA